MYGPPILRMTAGAIPVPQEESPTESPRPEHTGMKQMAQQESAGLRLCQANKPSEANKPVRSLCDNISLREADGAAKDLKRAEHQKTSRAAQQRPSRTSHLI